MLDKLLDLVVQFLELFKFWHVVYPYKRGLVLRLGKLHRKLDCGFHWIIPLGIDYVLEAHVVPTTHSLGNESVTTKDGRAVGFHAVVTYRVKDPEKALLEVEDEAHAVRDACAGEIGRVLREATWDEIQQPEIVDKLTAAARKRGFRYGVEIMSVQLAGMVICKSLRLMQSGDLHSV